MRQNLFSFLFAILWAITPPLQCTPAGVYHYELAHSVTILLARQFSGWR
jgi:hypothetical protein